MHGAFCWGECVCALKSNLKYCTLRNYLINAFWSSSSQTGCIKKENTDASICFAGVQISTAKLSYHIDAFYLLKMIYIPIDRVCGSVFVH